jgi:hypothetical protein
MSSKSSSNTTRSNGTVLSAADEMEVNDDEMPSVPILPNTESTPAAELFPDDMIDDEDTELIQESV